MIRKWMFNTGRDSQENWVLTFFFTPRGVDFLGTLKGVIFSDLNLQSFPYYQINFGNSISVNMLDLGVYWRGVGLFLLS